MGILSDRQIEAAGIITNGFFKRDYAKQTNVISAGVGSYGYDCRIGWKFKVFKPYPCVVIDPKNFDERAFEHVDLTPAIGGATGCAACEGYGYHEDSKDGPNMPPEQIPCVRCDGKGVVPVPNDRPDHIMIPPNSFILGESIEEFYIPRSVLCVVVGKSTYARCGLVVNVTPGEPEWKGKWTIEISNTTPLPAKVYCGEGVMQCLFFRSDEKAEALENGIKHLLNRMTYDAVDADTTPADIESYLTDLLKKASCETSYADKKGKYDNATGIDVPKVLKKE